MNRKLEFEILEDRTLPSSGLACPISCPQMPPAPAAGDVVAATSMEATSAVDVGLVLVGIQGNYNQNMLLMPHGGAHVNHNQTMLLMPHGGVHVNHNQTLKRLHSPRRKKS